MTQPSKNGKFTEAVLPIAKISGDPEQVQTLADATETNLNSLI